MDRITPLESRNVRLFISSTFSDMQKEREILAKRVFPKIRAFAKKRGVNFNFVDLRWGITQEDAEAGKIVELCMREIDSCRPLFLGLLGYKYGWIPGEEEIKRNPDLEKYFPWIIPLLKSGKSITEIEISYGTIMRESEALFFLRNDIENICEQQLDIVKKLQEHYKTGIYRYDDIENMAIQVEQYLQNWIIRNFPCDIWDDEHQYYADNRFILYDHLSSYAPRPYYSQKLIGHILSSETGTNITYLCGDEGVGKSAILCDIIKELKQRNIPYIYDLTGDSSCINTWIKPRYDEFCLSGRMCVMILTNKDNCLVNTVDNPGCEWFLKAPTNIKVIVETRNKHIFEERKNSVFPQIRFRLRWNFNDQDIRNRAIERTTPNRPDISDNDTIYMNTPDNEECIEIINNKLSEYGKKLPHQLLEKIVGSEYFHKPDMLLYLLDELAHYGCHECLENKIGSFLKTTDIASFYSIIDREYDDLLGNRLCSRIRSFLCHFCNPVEENVIKSALGLSHYDWSRYVNSYSAYLLIDNRGVRLRHRLAPSPYMSKEKAFDLFLDFYETETFTDYSNTEIVHICADSSDPVKWLSKYLTIPEIYGYDLNAVMQGWLNIRNIAGYDTFYPLFSSTLLGSNWEYSTYRRVFDSLCDIFPEYQNLIQDFGLLSIPSVDNADFVRWLFDARKWLSPETVSAYMHNAKNIVSQCNQKSLSILYDLIEIQVDATIDEPEDLTIQASIARLNKLLERISVCLNNEIDISLIEEILTVKTMLLMGIDRNDDALASARQALVFSKDPHNVHILISRIYLRQKEYQLAVNEASFAVSSFVETSFINSSDEAKLYLSVADIFAKIEERDAERFYLQHALLKSIPIYGRNSEFVAEIYNKLGNSFYAIGQFEKAAGCYRKYCGWLSKSHPDTKEYYDGLLELAVCCNRLDKFSEILDIYMLLPDEFIESQENHIEYAAMFAVAFHHLKYYDRAIKLLEDALKSNLSDENEFYLKYLLLNSLCYGNRMDDAICLAKELLDSIKTECLEIDEDIVCEIESMYSTANYCISGNLIWEDSIYARSGIPREWIEKSSNTDITDAYPLQFKLNHYERPSDLLCSLASKILSDDSEQQPDLTELLSAELKLHNLHLLDATEVSILQNRIMSEWINTDR